MMVNFWGGKGRDGQTLSAENSLTGLFKFLQNIYVDIFSCQVFLELSVKLGIHPGDAWCLLRITSWPRYLYKPTRGEILLDLVPTYTEELIKEDKIGSSPICRNMLVFFIHHTTPYTLFTSELFDSL